MSIIAYDVASAARTAPAARKEEGGFFARLFDRFMAHRQAQAMAELRRHAILLPHELEQAGWKINERSEDSLPFRR
jgi:hypothetical protein